ncbi:MAG: GAF domain-containing protein [Deltaproteobacteria bacterium]|nr:GAF domain-containing protein [Deltaproteobacteria bacterium]
MSDHKNFEEHVLNELETLRGLVNDLQRFHNERSCVFEEAYRIGQTHTVLNRLLYIAMENISLEDMLQKFIYEVTSLSWLSLQSKGAIFLIETDPGVLKLTAHHGMSCSMVKMCDTVPFDRCICGRAASSGKIQFADCLDDRHEQKYKGMAPHGHYCVPIISREREILGVLTLYLNVGHCRNQYEEGFLISVANTVAGLVEIKKIHQKLEDKAVELENRQRDLDEINTTLRVLLNKRDDDRLELEEEFLINVKELIQPYLENLKRTQLSALQRSYIDAVESNLKNILSPFRRRLSSQNLNLTSTELQVADLIIDGRRTKEIAPFLNVSEKTIAVHRKNIRRKLGLRNTKTSLRAHLLSFQK